MRIIDVMGCVGSAVTLLFAAAWIPFIGPFFSLLIPLPFLYYATKLGLFEGIKIAAVTLLTVGLIANLAGYLQIIFFCLELGLMGLVLSEIYRKKLTIGLTVFWGTCCALFMSGVFLTLIALSRKMGPLEMLLEYFQSNLREMIAAYENTGLEPDKVSQLKEYGKALTEIIKNVYPALLIIGSGSVVWLVVVLSRPLFRLGNLRYPDFGPMDRWQAPELLVWGLIAAGFSLFLPIAGIRFLAINTVIVVLVIYAFQGLSIALFFLNKYNIHLLIRFGIYLFIIFQQILWVGLAMAGLFDQWVDFRRIDKRAGE